jgi:ATP-dependent DNA helicase RecG
MNLNSSVGNIPLVGPIYRRRLEKLEISTVGNLLHHVPSRYEDYSLVVPIKNARVGDTVTLKGELTFIKNQYTKSGKKIQIAELTDVSGKILLVWFNQVYLVMTLHKGSSISVSGKIEWYGREKAMISPEFEKIIDGQPLLHTGKIVPIYPETFGISSKWLRSRIKKAYDLLTSAPVPARRDPAGTNLCFEEFLPKETVEKLNLCQYNSAIKAIHFPDTLADTCAGRERLAFNELLFLQLANLHKKLDWRKNTATYQITSNKKASDEFTESLPFTLTASQKRSVAEILSDLSKDFPANRLLEGDVGSGKTVVAATAAFAAFAQGYQSVFMAPTQILAKQHFNTLSKLFAPFKVRVNLITSDEKVSDLGRTDIFVGTHALIHQKVPFDKVALVVIDEQHRFGVEQRAHLVKLAGKKRLAPHVLTMTATPIPRTIALTLYGDLDLSTLDELPAGRQKITTWVVPPLKRKGAYKWIEKKILNEKAQAFIVCPLIEESEIETMKSVKAVKKEFEDLKKVFPELKLGLLHGKLSAGEKNDVIKKFKDGKIDILVSTPVVEVGIDIPNATIMLVEAAERFGLASLHQLRGRVGRGEKKSYCLLFTENKSEKVLARLSAMERSASGFELAELDLKLRGPGEIFGLRQHGFPELKIASWNDFDLIKKSKEVAEEAFQNPKRFELLFTKLKSTQLAAN